MDQDKIGKSYISTEFKNFSNAVTEKYLTENYFYIQFSLLYKFYYTLARPVMPLFIRHWMQNRYTLNIQCFENFIWPELVDLMKSHEKEWAHFIKNLYPEDYQTSIILTHNVETQNGYNFIPKVIELEQKYGFRGSWNLVPYKYKLHEEIIKYIQETGNEIGIHGYNHDGKLYFSESFFNFRQPYIDQALEKYQAVGFCSPLAHRNLNWLQKLNIRYDVSCFDYDPYQPFPGGTGSIWPFMAGKFVEMSFTVPQDHVLFYTLKKKNIDIWKNKTLWLLQNHGTILTLNHPDYLMEKNHLELYEEYLVFLKNITNAWHCLPREMAEWVHNGKVIDKGSQFI